MTQTQARIIYPKNTATCETNEQWAGRNLLRSAFLKSSGHSREYKGQGPTGHREVLQVISGDRPLYWSAESPETSGRQHFPLEIAERDAAHVRAFLEANGVNVTAEQEDMQDYIGKTPWEQRDLVRVYGNGSHCDPHADDPATVAALPEMKRKLWNLVRFDYEAYEF